MPELPEVETVVRSVAPHVLGRKIQSAELRSSRVTRGDFKLTAAGLRGKTIQRIRRRGKQMFFELDEGVLYVHLGMTGKLLWDAEPGPYSRAIFDFAEGRLIYDDVRQFGRVEYFPALPEMFTRVGPDALEIGFDEFYARLRDRSSALKTVLLNQSFVSGIGNIYADEALFAAHIHPRARPTKLSRRRALELYGRIVDVLKTAIEHRGSSISDYVDASGGRGSFQTLHAVYGRTGEPCARCGTAIRRIVLGGRSTHYCPRCQRV